ncbi:MAG: response regulator [Candidatus Dormibacteria bacterium]|jgi:CheY-like chemotaxis protein
MASAIGTDQPHVCDWCEPAGSATCPGSETRPARCGGRLCALVAEADGESTRLLQDALQGGGFDVIPAESGVAALEMICAIGPDVIVTDLDGRDLDGFVLCRVLRGLAAHFMLPVLVLTNKAAEDAGALAMAALGNVRVMRKPAIPVLVVAAAAEMLNIVPVGSRSLALPGRVTARVPTMSRVALTGG